MTNLDIKKVTSKGQERHRSCDDDNDELSQEEQEVDHTVQNDHPGKVPHDQIEGRRG